MSHQQAEAVLAMWREVERALDMAEPGSREQEGLIAEASRLRDEYQRLIQERIDEDRAGLGERTPSPSEA